MLACAPSTAHACRRAAKVCTESLYRGHFVLRTIVSSAACTQKFFSFSYIITEMRTNLCTRCKARLCGKHLVSMMPLKNKSNFRGKLQLRIEEKSIFHCSDHQGISHRQRLWSRFSLGKSSFFLVRKRSYLNSFSKSS